MVEEDRIQRAARWVLLSAATLMILTGSLTSLGSITGVLALGASFVAAGAAAVLAGCGILIRLAHPSKVAAREHPLLGQLIGALAQAILRVKH